MARSVPEWVGPTDDSRIPVRVKRRVMAVQDDRCAGCHVTFGAGVRPEFDHCLAIINGGENRERNLQALCSGCHAPKTKADVAIKAKTARVAKKHLGLKTATRNPIPGSKGHWAKRTVDGRTINRKTGEEI